MLVLFETFARRFHLPPEGLSAGPLRILDLGVNIGLTAVHLATLYPEARILGVELDRENTTLARANVSPYADRCKILNGAVWGEHEDLAYGAFPGHEYVFRVGRKDSLPENIRAVDVIEVGENVVTVSELIEQLAPDSVVDYIKMDIEGAERDVLTRNTDWATRVRSMKVEVHEPYTCEQCLRDLRRLGFTTRLDDRRADCVVALRQ